LRNGGPLIRRIVLTLTVAVVLMFSAFEGGANANSVGGCPSGDDWQLVSVTTLGISPEQAAGIPSIDGNGDGDAMTCVSPSPAAPGSFPAGAFIVRDNIVQATS
jgi:hypothetical protein